MTTFPPIQPRPIICKTTTNNIQSSSPSFPVQSSIVTNTDFNSSQTSASSSPYEEFLKRLREFHRCRQTTFRYLPTIAGQLVDLHLLYNTVVNHGGWDKVNDRQLWSSIASHFSIDSSCLNGTQALKNIYIRHLYAFEKISNGESVDLHDDENEDSKRRTVSQLQRVPQSYNHSQHSVSDAMRNQHGLFNDFIRSNEYEKLELALLSGFPNELTFALNTLTLLSSSTNHSKSFHLYKCPRLLDLLFRHIGLSFSSESFNNDDYLKYLYDNVWSKHLNYHMSLFWIESCSPKILKLLLDVDTENNPNFNLNSNENQQEQEFRIEQILMIIRNLSFHRLNALYLLDTIQLTLSTTYRFLLLLSYCEKKVELQKYTYDIWTNLAVYMHLRMISNDEGLLFRQLLNNMLNGDDDDQQQRDRFKIIRALEIISNLAHAGNDNRIYLMDYIQIIVLNLIHIPDILILVHTLECLYQLSELGEQLCNAILKVQSSISIITTLIDLLTIEARSFSSQTIKTIKIVEMSSGPVLLPTYHQPPQSLVVIPTNQPTQHAIDNSDINRPNHKLIVQQHSKPLPVTGVTLSGNLLSVMTPSTIATNAQTIENKRKHDSISETIAAVVNGTSASPPPPKRSRPSRARSTLSKTPVTIPSTSVEDESSMESNNTANHIHSTMADLLDRCSSSPSDNDIQSCINDLCQRVVSIVDQSSSSSNIYNQIPSPVFKRKMEIQPPKVVNHVEEQTQKKKRNRPPSKKVLTDQIPVVTEKNEELSDVKPTTLPSNIVQIPLSTNTSDYICEWDNCRASFPAARSVFQHVCSAHVKHSSDYICLWNGCDRLKRQKWALISHIQERHCSEVAFRQAKLKLINPTLSTTTNAVPSTISNRSSTAGTVSYTPDAAWLSVRRHLQMNLCDDQIKNKEGPLTKSIRLTAALILRNIARYSAIGKQNLRQYEQLIANLALDSSEASSTLISCLFELYN